MDLCIWDLIYSKRKCLHIFVTESWDQNFVAEILILYWEPFVLEKMLIHATNITCLVWFDWAKEDSVHAHFSYVHNDASHVFLLSCAITFETKLSINFACCKYRVSCKRIHIHLFKVTQRIPILWINFEPYTTLSRTW